MSSEASKGIAYGFDVAHKAASSIAFTMHGFQVFSIMTLIIIYKEMYFTEKPDYKEYLRMYECIAGYGLGTCIVSIFTWIGGGIYNKAADVSSDLVGKVIAGLEEDSPLNPGIIADHVGDNVGAVVGACGDFYGSLSESLCAAMILCSLSSELVENAHSYYFYPFMIISAGSLVCMCVSILFGTFL